MPQKFKVHRHWGILVSTHNEEDIAGNTRLLSIKGPVLFTYIQPHPQADMRLTWYFFLFAIFFIAGGKPERKKKWYLNWVRLTIKKECDGFSIRFQKANRYLPDIWK